MLAVIRRFEDRYRVQWLVAGVLVASAVLFLPIIAIPSTPEPAAIAVVQVLIAGGVIGVARQGIDVLALRLFVSSLAILLAIGLTQSPNHPMTCSNAVNCVQVGVLAILLIGVLGGAVLGIVALPTAALWNLRLSSLRPEFKWPRLRWWQWLLIVLIGTPILGLLLGIPWSG